MNRPFLTIFLAIFFITFPLSPFAQENKSAWEVYFSPQGGAMEAIVKSISAAKNSVLVQAYSFTSAPIAKALLHAHKRGVKVEVLLDKRSIGKNKEYSTATFFLNEGIPFKIDTAHSIAHNKVIIIDGETVITGSFNFTKAAEGANAENLLIIHDKKLGNRYTKNWQDHERHSDTYSGKAEKHY